MGWGVGVQGGERKKTGEIRAVPQPAREMEQVLASFQLLTQACFELRGKACRTACLAPVSRPS